MAVSAQWSLDVTANSALTVAQGIFHAATSDNVQPLALLACEQFGCTVTMCRETCRKIETTVLPTDSPAVINFLLRGVVGYSRNDSATRLGTTASGVRFLGLVAPLVTTMGAFDSAMALSLMLENSAADISQLPTTKQLQDLLSALNGRLSRARFTDSILGWHQYLHQHPDIDDNRRAFLRKAATHPSAAAIEKLLHAFRRLHLIEEDTVSKVVITLGSSAPWVIAFTRWCLGIIPAVNLENGTSMIEQPGSNIEIIIDTMVSVVSTREIFRVAIYHDIGDLETLLAEGTCKRWVGMTSIENYGQWKLKEYGLDQTDTVRVLQECLPYAAKEFVTKAYFMSTRPGGQKKLPVNWAVVRDLRPVPFGSDSTISEILWRMLNASRGTADLELKNLQPVEKVVDLPLTKLHLEFLRKHCPCVPCFQDSFSEPCDGKCLRAIFLRNVTHFLCDALALSLFQLSDNLQVRLENGVYFGDDSDNDELFYNAVGRVFRDKDVGNCDVTSIICRVLDLVGHDGKREMSEKPWAMSCFRGQAVYPTIFTTQRIRGIGYLTLSWLPGELRFKGIKYEVVKSESNFLNNQMGGFEADLSSKAVHEPVNLFPDYKSKWRVEAKDGYLNLNIYVQGSYDEVARRPLGLLQNLANCCLTENCPHPDRNAKLDQPDDLCVYKSPLYPSVNKRGLISVIAVDGADDLRFCSLNEGIDHVSAVVRMNSCLKCSLEVCRRVRCSVLIL